MRRRALPPMVAVLMLLAQATVAAPVALEPLPGTEVTAEERREQDRYVLPIGSFSDLQPTALITGTITRTALRTRGGAPSVLAVIATYRKRLRELGFRRLLDCGGDACGGFDFRFGAELMAPPAMRMDVRDFAQLSAGREEPPAYASVLVSRVRDAIYIQTVIVEPDGDRIQLVGTPLDGPVEMTAPGPARGGAQLPPPAPAAGGGAPPDDTPDRRPLLDRLLQNGHARVTGLSFATGGAKLTADSVAALDEMANLLTANPDLRIAIVGHSDNVGSLDGNIELSRKRAAAVRRALIDRGVAAARLEARGDGYLAPIR